MRKMKQKKEIGAIGIGTLIVFIALILVAAIAAAVIIGTAEELEENAERVTEDARTMIRQLPRIVRAEGEVAANSHIDDLFIYLHYIGSDGIDMNKIVIHILVEPNGGIGDYADLTLNIGSIGTASSDYFGTEQISDPLDHWDPLASPPRYIIGEGTMLRLTIDLSSAATTLPPDSDLRLEITSSNAGGKTIDEWETPAAYPSIGSIVTLQG